MQRRTRRTTGTKTHPTTTSRGRGFLSRHCRPGIETLEDRLVLATGPMISIDDVSVPEGDTAVFSVALSQPSAQTVTVDYYNTPITAGAADYDTSTAGTLTFAPGVTLQTIAVTTNTDFVQENDEAYRIFLHNATNSMIADFRGDGTIVDTTPPLPQLVIGDVTVAEGNTAQFVVLLTAPSAQTVTVDYYNAPITAGAADYDTSVAGTLTFNPGETLKAVAVQTFTDTVVDFSETYRVFLAGATNATIADHRGDGTIINTTVPAPALTIDDAGVTEGNTAEFIVRLSSPSTQSVTVDYYNAPITAGAADYDTSVAGTLTFGPGATLHVITVTTNMDFEQENDETYRIFLENPTGAVIADHRGDGTIVDVAPPIPAAARGVLRTEGVPSSPAADAVFDKLADDSLRPDAGHRSAVDLLSDEPVD